MCELIAPFGNFGQCPKWHNKNTEMAMGEMRLGQFPLDRRVIIEI